MSTPIKTYRSTKTYGHEVGLSCAFRQWRAKDSHCRFLHGYALAVKIEFVAETLDSRNWVVDFGSLESFKSRLRERFDHKTVIAQDDPKLDYFRQGRDLGVLDLVVLQHVGCEKFAEEIFGMANEWLGTGGLLSGRVKVASVTVSEHGANSATYSEEDV